MTSYDQTSSAAKPNKCPWCGSIDQHSGHCPSVKAFEYHPDGTIKRVEFVTPTFDTSRWFVGGEPPVETPSHP